MRELNYMSGLKGEIGGEMGEGEDNWGGEGWREKLR